MTREQFKDNLLDVQSNLRGYALKLTQDSNEADDLIQDTTLRALRNSDKFIENINFKGWVMTIMHNIFLNNRNKLTRKRNFIDSNVDISDVSIVVTGGYSSPEGKSTLRDIYTAVNTLNKQMRLPFLMYLQGYKYYEIAEKMEIPLGTVKSRIFFARKTLQEQLKEFE